jgi:hypothetical protein
MGLGRLWVWTGNFPTNFSNWEAHCLMSLESLWFFSGMCWKWFYCSWSWIVVLMEHSAGLWILWISKAVECRLRAINIGLIYVEDCVNLSI